MHLSETSNVFDQLEREIWIVTAADGPRRGGLVATSVTQASISPEAPRLLVGISRLHATWGLIDKSQRFAVHLLAANRIDLLERFGACTSREIDKFVGLPLRERSEDDHNGPPLLADSIGGMDCRVEAAWDAGDRTFFLGEVVETFPLSPDVPVMTTRDMGRVPQDVRESLRSQFEADAIQDLENIRRWRSRRDHQKQSLS